MRRRILLCGSAIALFAGLGLWLRPRPMPNLLVITLDTTRADRLGCYGYSAGRTPVLDSLAAEGVLCERAYTVAPITLPAHVSLFTGLYPPETGVLTNGRGRLDDTVPTLAAALKRQGYDTAAFVAAVVLNRRFGLDRGFEAYDDDWHDEQDQNDSNRMHHQRSGQAVVDAALEWLTKKRSRPFFCWVHLFDPHFPYLEHADLFGNDFAERPYDAEIAYADRQVGRLVEFLKSHGLEGQTLIVVAGDHGEGLRDHGERTHAFTLYNETTHVPLIFRQPGRLPSGRRVSANVSLVDVSPTILDLLGAADLRKATGKSLRPVLAGAEGPTSPCYGGTDEPFLSCGWSPLRSMTVGNWKYIRTTKAELYDLANDPAEQHNLAELQLDKLQEMEARLADFESRLVPRAEIRVQLSAAERQALASLGYAGGASGARSRAAHESLPDVKDMLPVNDAVEDAADLLGQGSLDEGIERLREIVQKSPGHTVACLYLANSLSGRSEFEEAVKVLRKLVTAMPEFPDGHNELGVALLRQGRFDEAQAEFLKTLDLDPGFADAHVNLAQGFVLRGYPEEALAHLNAALQIDRCHSPAYQWRARICSGLGRIPEAIADFGEALKWAPNSSDVHYDLGALLVEQGQSDEALRHLARAVELRPRSAQFQYALGALLLREHRYDEAIRHLAEALELRPGFAAADELLQKARQMSARQKPAPE